jgi:polyisoprenoid-binding protein YceI
LLLAAVTAGAATAWVSDDTHGRLLFTATQAGGDFDGSFERFRADIDFDPADLPHSRFRVEIQTASVDTGDGDRDRLLAGSDFFAAERWPVARFEASRFAVLGLDRFEARGTLTIRDVTRELVLPFAFRPAPDGATAELEGGTSIRRLDFGVGQGEWRDTELVGDDVGVRFDLILQRK